MAEPVNYVYAVFLDGKANADNAKVVDGRYYFKIYTQATTLVTLFCMPPYHPSYLKNKNIISFLTEPTSLNVISTDSFSNIQPIQSKAYKDYVILEKRCSIYSSQLGLLFSIQSKNKSDDVAYKIDSTRKELSKIYYQFIQEKPNSLTIPIVLERYLSSVSDNPIQKDIEFAQATYSKFTKVQKESYYGVRVKKKLESYDIKIGITAPNFIQTDTANKLVSLNDFRKNKYVLIDFWASWCGPCRIESPYMRELYNQYASKGFDIISVSLDNNKEKWLNAISKDSLYWTHVSDLQYWNNNIAKLYKVNAVPTKILIDKKGIIIGKYIGIDEQKLLAKKLYEIFP